MNLVAMPPMRHHCNMCHLQTRPDTTTEKGFFRISHRLRKCSSMGHMCTKSLRIFYSYQGTNTTVELSDAVNTARIDDHMEDIFNAWPRERDFKVLAVKQATSMFALIRGLGFRILYSPNNAIYIQVDPYFRKKVSWNGLHVLLKCCCCHDSVTTWKCFSHCLSFVRGIYGQPWIPVQVIESFDVFLVVSWKIC